MATNAQAIAMKPVGLIALLLSTLIAGAGAPPTAQRVGDTYEITLTRESVQQGSNSSSGSSHDKDALLEKVVGLRADGVDLEYDLPSLTAEERTSYWQFPARIFKPFNGPAQLLNSPELEARLDAWLKDAKWPRTVCGHWIFTWNAFRIECDPQSVIKTVASFDLRSDDIRDGASYRDAEASSSGRLAMKTTGSDGATFSVELSVDPDAVRHERAEADVVTGEILRKPVTIEAALSERAKEAVSGTISVAFETNSSGMAYRRTRIVKLEIKSSNGQSETQAITETLERRLISQSR